MKLWKLQIHQIINEADTKPGKNFEYLLFGLILLAFLSVALESVGTLDQRYHWIIRITQWIIMGLFTIEYIVRVIVPERPIRFIFSFHGIVDLIAVLALYTTFTSMQFHYLVVIRILRFLSIFRILKFVSYKSESKSLLTILHRSRSRIFVFVFAFLLLCVVLGTVMYLIEPVESGFNSIPESIYWCIVTLTTVGYGDITPVTILGKFFASLISIIGYGTLVVSALVIATDPTSRQQKTEIDSNTQTCSHCLNSDHKDGAIYCHACGNSLEDV